MKTTIVCQHHVHYLSLVWIFQDNGFGELIQAPYETGKFVCDFVSEDLH